jgi:signal transduction histidine kinase
VHPIDAGRGAIQYSWSVHPKHRRRTRRLVVGAVGIIVLLWGVVQVVGFLQWREVQASADRLERASSTDIALAERIGLDVERERILIDRHIFENDAEPMKDVEARLALVKADLAAAVAAYGHDAITADLASVNGRAERALEVSRANRDADAHALMTSLEPVFDRVDRAIRELVDLDQARADDVRARTRASLDHFLAYRVAVTGVLIAITIGIGIWLTRAISRTERELQDQAAQLQDQAAQLEARNRELDAFAGLVAHDLRGPLNTVSLAGAALAERLPNPGRAATIFENAVAQMATLVDDLLRLARVVKLAPDTSARTEPVATAIERDLGPRVTDVGGTLRVDLEPGDVHCSEALLRQVLWNLGENALKYRRPDVPPRIELVGRATRDGYDLRVSDNGPGMTPDDAKHAFEPFYRAERTRALPGTGLGLAIVRRVVDASGGVVSIESEPGSGTTFLIHLPPLTVRPTETPRT